VSISEHAPSATVAELSVRHTGEHFAVIRFRLCVAIKGNLAR